MNRARLDDLLGDETLVADVLARYGEPGRHYHTVEHVDAVLDAIDLWYPTAPTWIRLAAVYHDVVYDPHSTSNEADSAVHAYRQLCERRSTAELGWIHEAIVMTAHHRLDVLDYRLHPLLVGDLISMACPREAYRANTARIRAEYAHASDEQWAAGRQRFIASFLVHRILPFEARFDAPEAVIRENMIDELERLDPRFAALATPLND